MQEQDQSGREPVERGPIRKPAEIEDEAGLPPEALDEAERWDDVPVQDPEESTGIDAG